MPELLTLDEVAEKLKVSRETVARMVDRRELRAIRLGGQPRRSLRVDATELAESLKRWSAGGDAA